MYTNPLTHRGAGILLAVALLIAPVVSRSDMVFPATEGTTDATNSGATTPPTDLVDDRPTMFGMIWHRSTQVVGSVWGVLRDDVFSWVTPPTPTDLTHSVSKQDAVELFKMLGYTGYKLKEIHTDVGVIPRLSFKFTQSNQLSEADYEYLESQLDEWEHKSPGVYAALQRKIINTIMTVNLGGEYQVSSLEVSLLPLPDVEFVMSTKQQTLGPEGETLMRAIQRVGRDVRTLEVEQRKK